MRFSALRTRVRRCEQVVSVRLENTHQEWGVLSQVWRKGWSPLRIVVVGLAGGFIAGKLELPRKVNGARWLQMAGSVSNLFTTAQAAFASVVAAQAAAAADQAADQVDEAADEVAAAAAAPAAAPTTARPARAVERPASTAPANVREPQPAEAATELSER